MDEGTADVRGQTDKCSRDLVENDYDKHPEAHILNQRCLTVGGGGND